MELLCPTCRGTLEVVAGGERARCTLKGCSFQVLHLRSDARPTVAVSTPSTTCRRHPAAPAHLSCVRCHTAVCDTCAFRSPTGQVTCPDCAVQVAASGPDTAAPVGMKCPRHPAVAAVRTCCQCGQGICATCDFALPGGLHACPECATRKDRSLTGTRRTMLIASYALAAWGSVGLVLLLALSATATDPAQVEMYGILFSIFVFIPTLAGIGLSVGTLESRLGNPPAVWGAVAWNGLVTLVMVALTIIGTFMGE